MSDQITPAGNREWPRAVKNLAASILLTSGLVFGFVGLLYATGFLGAVLGVGARDATALTQPLNFAGLALFAAGLGSWRRCGGC